MSADTDLLAKSVPGPVLPKSPSSVMGPVIYFSFRRVFYILSGFHIRSGFYFRNRGGTSASRTCDPRTTVEVISVRLTSPERVTTTGVGASSRAAGTETDSLATLLRPTLLVRTVSVVSSELFNQNGVTEST